MAKQKVAYDEASVKSLDALSHIRLRTGMYIGRIGDGANPADGIYVLLKEVVDNSIDEFIMGSGRKVEITRDAGNRDHSRLRTRHSPGQSHRMRQPDQYWRQVQ